MPKGYEEMDKLVESLKELIGTGYKAFADGVDFWDIKYAPALVGSGIGISRYMAAAMQSTSEMPVDVKESYVYDFTKWAMELFGAGKGDNEYGIESTLMFIGKIRGMGLTVARAVSDGIDISDINILPSIVANTVTLVGLMPEVIKEISDLTADELAKVIAALIGGILDYL